MFEKPRDKNGAADFYTAGQGFQITGYALATHAMPDKVCLFVGGTDNFGEFRNPVLNPRASGIGQLRHNDLISPCFQFLFEPLEPALLRGSVPTVHYKNSFVHKIIAPTALCAARNSPPAKIRKGGGAAPLTISNFSLAANFLIFHQMVYMKEVWVTLEV